ncbi:chemotaxis protein CheW [Marinobacter halodurans]|uniref:Chemotaxis protein CheW n=1 Tax=Marinobacter halodurans TaxID=2528979 RepID=A0ABY1ZQM0_9GAMM|nr:chemotaxis protein CheW [Marinobacter halodurans]TBW59419.1 chemotaxis protein CheW [Marinobacter halodurans]
MQEKSQKADYVDPTAALSSYLDELLFVATSAATETETETSTEVKAEAPAKPVDAAPAVDVAEQERVKQAEREARRARVRAQAQRVKARRAEAEKRRQAEALRQAEAKSVATETTPVAPEVETAADRHAQPNAQPAPQGRPAWADQAFECLIFRVAGLQLAVPLVLLGAIHRMDTDLHSIPGRPRWFMGMMPSGEHNLRVVDTAEWVMSGRVPEGAREGYQFVIRLDDSEWGLACDEVAQSFTLRPDDVRWRSERSRRPWLAGTVVDHMCALLDVGAMTQLLSRAEREQKLDLN